MTILVTGASGFLGGALTKVLVEQGKNVRLLARKTSNLDHLKNLQVDVVYGDVRDKASLIPAFQNVTIVYHCAAISTDWAPWTEFYQTNVLGVQNMLDIAQTVKGLRRFLHVSTTDVYGYPNDPCDETYPIIDTGLPYNKSKGLGEKRAWEFTEKTGLPLTIIRPATIYGPRSKDFVLEIAKLLIKKQMMTVNKGNVFAGLLYIDNAVEGIIEAANSSQTVGKSYNLRDEKDKTWEEYTGALAKGLQVNAPRINFSSNFAVRIAYIAEMIHRVFRIRNRPILTRHAAYLLFKNQDFPIQKAQQDFNFQSRTSFSEGMKKTIAWLDLQNLT